MKLILSIVPWAIAGICIVLLAMEKMPRHRVSTVVGQQLTEVGTVFKHERWRAIDLGSSTLLINKENTLVSIVRGDDLLLTYADIFDAPSVMLLKDKRLALTYHWPGQDRAFSVFHQVEADGTSWTYLDRDEDLVFEYRVNRGQGSWTTAAEKRTINASPWEKSSSTTP